METTSWLPVSAAASATGIPERTLFRWVRAGKVPTRKGPTGVLVDVGAIKGGWPRPRTGETTTAANPDGSGGSRASSDSGSGRAPAPEGKAQVKVPPSGVEIDGDLAGRLFAAFERGDSPTQIVCDLKVRPDLVLAAWSQFNALRQASQQASPTLADLVGTIGARLAAVEQNLAELAAWRTQFAEAFEGWAKFVNAQSARLGGLPIPTAADFVCSSCQARGAVSAMVGCVRCGSHQQFAAVIPEK